MNQALLSSLGLNLEVKENEVVEGGKFEDIPAGTYGARLVGVVETGQHPGFQEGKIKDETILVFQLFGKKVPEVKDKDGNLIPRVEFVRLNKTFGSKGNFLPVFGTLNNNGPAVNFFQLIGTPCRIKREEYKKMDGSTGIKTPLPGGILGTLIEVLDEDGMGTGEYKNVNVPEATADIMVYQWNFGTQEQFDTLPYWMQKAIKEALNIEGSRAEHLTMKEDPKKATSEEEPAEEVKAPPKQPKKPVNTEEEFDFA